MAAEAEWEDRFLKPAVAKAAAAAAAVTKDGTVPAMVREAAKDVRSTIHEIFFGRPEGACEPGAPLNPTQGEVAAGRRGDSHPYGRAEPSDRPLPSPGYIAHDRGIHGKEGQILEQKSWQEREIERGRKPSEDGNDENEPVKGRSLPEEERERKERERDEGRGR